MKTNIECPKCNTENVVIENALFFSGEIKDHNIYCSICNEKISILKTDGWFFVQSKDQYEFEEKIENQKKEITFD